MNKGFTILEVLISIAIFTAILGIVLSLGFNISDYNTFLSENMYSQNEVELTLSAMAPEIRSMGPSNTGAFSLELAAPTSLTFYSDIDQDGLFERVRYFMSGTTLMKGIVKPSGSPLSYNLAAERTTESVHGVILGNPAVIFSYYAKKMTDNDPAMAQPVNPSLIKSIRVQVTADSNGQPEPGPVMFVTFTTIRNLQTNQ